MPPGSSESANRQPGLDGLRGLAAVAVFFHHTLAIPAGGFLGVDLFFVLSGFLITGLILRECQTTGRLRFGRFYFRRAVRLLPAFAAMIALYAILRFCFEPQLPGIGLRGAIEVLLWTNIAVLTPYLGHAWSLSIEWQFYLIWPFAAAASVGRHGKAGVAVLAAAGLAGGQVMLWIFHVDLKINGLLIGALLATCIAPLSRWVMALPWRWREAAIGAGVLGFTVLTLVSNYQQPFLTQFAERWASQILGALLIILASSGPGHSASWILCNPLARYCGRISYAM